MTDNFREVILHAKKGDPLAFAELMDMYKPLLNRESRINGETDHDLLQELWLTFVKCVQSFEV